MEKLPVMVWIHGGGYFSGSADGFEADFLLNNDVIVVRFKLCNFLFKPVLNYNSNG